MGIETEYAASGPTDRQGYIMEMLRLGSAQLECIPGPAMGDLFLGNGARVYLDCAEHPEVATPECSNPADVVRYVAAGDRILECLYKLYREKDPTGQNLELYKTNVDYSGANTTWGCHESYLSRRPPAEFIDLLVPHLVSRLVYTGAGGLNPLSERIERTLSPRVHHLRGMVTDGSTDRRGIFHTKDEGLAQSGFHRIHLICGESLCSHIATYLKCGTTALVIALIEHGRLPGDGVRLADPLGAMRGFAADETCRWRANLANGQALSALEIQRRYLGAVQACSGEPWLPDWAAQVCAQWAAMLERLADGPEAVQTRLDWAIKRALFRDRTLRAHREPARLKELRAELCEIDMRFGRVGPDGIFAALDAAGALHHAAPGVAGIEEAMRDAPADTRAHARGAIIRASPRRAGLRCDWQVIEDSEEGRVMWLTDPFATTGKWVPIPRPRMERWQDIPAMLEMLRQTRRAESRRSSDAGTRQTR